MRADFRIRGFSGGRHPSAPAGVLLLETWHRGIASAQIELSAWAERLRRGEASRVELIDCRRGGAATNLRISYPDDVRRINWN